MPRDTGGGLLSGEGGSYKPRKHDQKIQVDGYKYYEVQVYGKTFELKSGALGHVVVGLSPGSTDIALHSRLLQINDRNCFSAKEADVESALSENNNMKLLFERPERFEIRYDQGPFDFHFAYNEYGFEVTRIEEGGPAKGEVPIGALVTMVNGQSLIYKPATSLERMLRDCSFPVFVTFEVYGQVVNEMGQVILTDSYTKDGLSKKSYGQPMAVTSVPDEDSPLRENERKKNYPIIGICEWCAGFCTLLVGILLLSALAFDQFMHVDTNWSDDHQHVEHMSLVITSSQIVGESRLTPGYEFDFQDSNLCSMPDNKWSECMDHFDYGEMFGMLCDELKIWVGLNATACTLAFISAILIIGGKFTSRDTALLGFGWCLLAMGIGFVLTVTGSIIQMVNAITHIVNGEESMCQCIMHELNYQLKLEQYGSEPPDEFDSCELTLSASTILGSVTVAFWLVALCVLCSAWMNTPKTCLYVGDY